MKTHSAGKSQAEGKKATKRRRNVLPHEEQKVSAASVARALGVNKGHLCRVLKGERESADLMSRYYTYLADYRALANKSAKPATTEGAK